MRRLLKRLAQGIFFLLAFYYGLCTLALLAYRFWFPPITGVQLQRCIESWLAGESCRRTYLPRPRTQLSEQLACAVVAAEDTRFYTHWGFDWEALREAWEANRRQQRIRRGGSTITQQLVKNLFMTTHRSYLRKAMEAPLTLLAELLLSKERILTLYLNVVEWGPGIYGAEAAARYHYGKPGRQLTRYEAAALAACLPAPLRRRPQQMGWYTSIILERMRLLGC
ncbi:monofunctional biosynthetic peptidoglycan transglycosylase [Rhodothermus marinus SG0.5JP17-172]|jgi:monofunctional biosynthetic peptidoglycan transglycosylase|uniref:monofunctional biosynthetic peptidoglycan transglycosylase n=1 Tax=Rhodothermus marinus TaxID=29549 RepID=UPI000223DB69|nr:monofunctional biosynthetic peptidoglycan transglycosylase [Rhodothermus marinus]AEN73611.1 monofunctional biosynthetic peptidoglycan transglycosylase [Rhodothermus marinus SG0.5JP17-172]MBO2493060.1 monofunctional biosynthetic peptidoglycan transglycosylase [Rhodothermus marinus]